MNSRFFLPTCILHIVKIHIDCNKYDCEGSCCENMFDYTAHIRKVFNIPSFNTFYLVLCRCGQYARSLNLLNPIDFDKYDSSDLMNSKCYKVKLKVQSENVWASKDNG